MIEQLKTIREALLLRDMESCEEALAALTQLEAMVGHEPVAWMYNRVDSTCNPFFMKAGHEADYLRVGRPPLLNPSSAHVDWTPLCIAAPVAQQPQAPTESVLIDGIAYDIPAPVAAELLRLHIEARQPQAEAVSDDLRDRLVAIGQAIADQDDRGAQAMIREILAAPQQAEAVPVAVLHRGEGGAFRVSVGENLLAVYALPPGDHDLFTRPQQAEAVHPAVKPDTLVNRGALQMALNVLRRAGKDEVADELEKTIQPPQAESVPNTLQKAEAHLLNLIGEYWALAYAEGEEGRNHDTEDGAAQRTHAAIAKAVKDLIAAASSTPQQAEAVPPDVVRDAERYRWLRNESWAGYNTGKGTPSVYTVDGAGNRRMMLAEEAMDDAIDAAIAQQKGGV